MHFGALLLLAASLAACDRASIESARRPPDALSKVTTYEARGVLHALDVERGKAVIAHEEIPGYMDAMTMEFRLAPGEVIAGMETGDLVTFRLSVSERESRIDRLRKIGRGAVLPASAALPLELPAPGTPLPDSPLMDQSGRPFRLSDFKGRVLALTFIFTRCPLPDFCPRMNEQFRMVQRALQNTETGWHLLSVSIDPTYDTPERLAAYAARFEPDFSQWTFATGDASEIEKLAAVFGLQTVGEGMERSHNLRTVVLDPAGRVRKIFSGNEWKPSDLVEEMTQAMAAKP